MGDGAGKFGWDGSRFEFAIMGLVLGMGGAALTIALSVWVQTSSFVTLGELEKFPVRRVACCLACES